MPHPKVSEPPPRGAVWVADHHLGTVSRIDPASNTIVATIKVGLAGDSGPLELAAGGSVPAYMAQESSFE